MNEFDNGLEEKFDFDFSDPCVSQVKIDKLKEFIEKDKEAVIVFYGGEPLLQIDKIKEIMDNMDVPFRMQTNGIFLDKLPSEYLNRITKILVSLDGNQETTDKYRGKGTYQKIINNVNLIRKNGYKGEIVARMTVAQDNPDIYKNVTDLLSIPVTRHPSPVTSGKSKAFDSVHWQLDVGFYKTDYEKTKIKNFFEQYNKSISKLIDYWVKEIEKGNVLKIYPFLAIVDSILKEEPTKLRCGAGHSGYAISTSGKVVACPIMNNIESFKAGDLNTNPQDLKKFSMTEDPQPTTNNQQPTTDCAKCKILDLCGGRCMYWKKAGLWPEEGNKMICDSIKHYIKEIQLQMPKIIDSIINNVITDADFNYEKYFGPEIIP